MRILSRIRGRRRLGGKRWAEMFQTNDIAFDGCERSTLRIWALSVLSFLIVLFIATFSKANDPDSKIGIYTIEVKKTVDLSKVVCKVRNVDGFGCGVSVEQGVLTCWHLVRRGGKVTVTCDGETVDAGIVRTDENNDVALLSVKWKNKHPAIKVADESPVVGDDMNSAGPCKDGTFTIERHKVDEIVKYTKSTQYLYNNPPQSGRSGSPLLNDENELVSIQTGFSMETIPYRGRGAELRAIKAILATEKAVAAVEGVHSHKCSKCGTVWRHDHVSFGSTAHHTCPKCGAVNWDVYSASSPVVSPVIRYQQGNCPNGNCPLGVRRR